MAWLSLQVQTGTELVEPLAEALTACGAICVSIEDATGESALDGEQRTPALWPRNQLTALFAPQADAAAIIEQIERRLGTRLPCRLGTLPERAWESAWREHTGPLGFGGGLWVCPSGTVAPEPGAVAVFIDPGPAFGTGAHPTTALCLQWLAEHPPAGATVIDYGCGSGVLAIAALRLGARYAWGVDEDRRALELSTRNADHNGVAARYRALPPDALPPGPVADILLANILAEPLIELAPRLLGLLRTGGALALCGILSHQAPAVSRAYARTVQLEARFRQDERGQRWTLLAGRKHDQA